MINTSHSLTIHYIVKSTVHYMIKLVETFVDTLFFVFYCHHINVVFWSVCLDSRARDDHEISRRSVSQFSPLSVLVFSSAAPVSEALPLAPMHAGYLLCEPPRSLRCQSERIYWSFSLDRTRTRQMLMLA